MQVGRHNERGLSQSLPWALLTPLLMTVILLGVQTAVVLHGRQEARHAAMAGAEAEALFGAPQGTGGDLARQVALDAGLREVRVTTVRRNGLVTLTVHARAEVFLDLGPVSYTHLTLPTTPYV